MHQFYSHQGLRGTKKRLIKRGDGRTISALPSVHSASTKLSLVLPVLTHLPCPIFPLLLPAIVCIQTTSMGVWRRHKSL